MQTNLPVKLLVMGSISALSVIGGVMTQSSAHAEDATSTTTSSNPKQFCKQLPVIEQRFTDRKKTLEDKLATHDSTLAEKEAAWDKAIAAARIKADTERKQAYAQLEAAAKTNEDKQAVTAYEAKTEADVAAKRAAADAARQTFRQTLADEVTAKVENISTQLTDFSKNVQAEMNDARNKCNQPKHDDAVIAAGFKTTIAADASGLRDARDDKTVQKTISEIRQKREEQKKDPSATTTKPTAEQSSGRSSASSGTSASSGKKVAPAPVVTSQPQSATTDDTNTTSTGSDSSSGSASSGSESTTTSSGSSDSSSGRGDGSRGHTDNP